MKPESGPRDLAGGDRARLVAVVRGRVQGVGYRFFVVRLASGLDLDGWVANEPDGSVRCVVEGPRDRLAELLAALLAGPPGADVDRVDEQWQPPTDISPGFGIRSAGHRGD